MKIGITILLLALGALAPQDFSDMVLLKTIEKPIEKIRVDNFGKLYLIAGDEISLYTANGELITQNSNKLYGDITDLDATNGLETAVFFEDQLQTIYIDNQLAPKGRVIPFDELGLEQVTTVCTSHANGLWIYDQIKMELIRIDKNNKFVGTSGNLLQLLGYVPEPNYMREYANWLYVNDPKNGILVFDIFGAYYKTIPIKNVSEFQVKDKDIVYFSNPHLITFNTVDLMFDTAMKIDGNPKQVLLTKNQLNILYNNKLELFHYKP